MAFHLGDFRLTDTIGFFWTTHASDSSLAARTVAGTLGWMKQGTTTLETTGVTDTVNVGGVTGRHYCEIDVATAGLDPFADYDVVLHNATIDGVVTGGIVRRFSIEREPAAAYSGLLTAVGASAFTLEDNGNRDAVKAGDAIQIVQGTGYGYKLIATYDPATGAGTTESAFDTTPVIGDAVRVVSLPSVEPLGTAEIGTDAVTAIQAGLATGAAVAAVQADVDGIESRLPAALVGGKMDVILDGTGLTDAAAEKAADALLERNIDGGANTGRKIKDVMKRIRNKVAFSNKTPTSADVTVYEEDDATPAWTGSVTMEEDTNPVTGFDPA